MPGLGQGKTAQNLRPTIEFKEWFLGEVRQLTVNEMVSRTGLPRETVNSIRKSQGFPLV